MKIDSVALISILMPAYNCESYISQAIDSVLNQTHQNFELLIADDCSTDNTKKIIDSYEDNRIKRFHNVTNLGYLQASNKLVKEAKGEYIAFQDADDYSVNNRLEKLVKEFAIDSQLACVGSNVYRVDINNNIIGDTNFKTNHKEIVEDLPSIFNCVGSALMVKKQVIDELGLYNLFFDRIGSEDLYWFGLISYNFKVKNIKECLYYYRQTPNSISNQKNVSPRKLISIEFVKNFLEYYKNNQTEIFSNARALKILNLYLLGKANCWQGNYKTGLVSLSKSIFLNPCLYIERYSLLKIYLPKMLK